MSDLRWSDCDELAASDPIACLLCRTGKLNDHAHSTDMTLAHINSRVNVFGAITAVATVATLVFQIFLKFHP